MPGDSFGLPDNSDHQQWFYYTGTAVVVPWVKPLGISMIHFLAMAGGGGGGGGFTGATSTNRFGGGGGGAGATATLIIPAAFLPDRLWVVVGAPGAGGVGSSQGFAGTGSAVMLDNLEANGTAAISVISTLIAGGSLGAAGTSSAAGSGGGASATTTLPGTGGLYGWLGAYAIGPGPAGGSGALSITANTSITTGGAAGGEATSTNTDNAGGGITSSAVWVPMPFSVAGGTTLGGNGQSGIAQYKPLFFCGGTGGGSYAAGTGGTGGNGAIGCGGGGGGGGITGGAGGNGGPGLVVITCW